MTCIANILACAKLMFFTFFQVNAPFTIDHPTAASRIDTVFDCKQKQGVVPAHSTVRIPVSTLVLYDASIPHYIKHKNENQA